MSQYPVFAFNSTCRILQDFSLRDLNFDSSPLVSLFSPSPALVVSTLFLSSEILTLSLSSKIPTLCLSSENPPPSLACPTASLLGRLVSLVPPFKRVGDQSKTIIIYLESIVQFIQLLGPRIIALAVGVFSYIIYLSFSLPVNWDRPHRRGWTAQTSGQAEG